jgi:alpha-galactosidase
VKLGPFHVLKKGIISMCKRFHLITMVLFVVFVAVAPGMGRALDNGLAKTPPMGWNSWNKYACKGINEKVVRETADAMAAG